MLLGFGSSTIQMAKNTTTGVDAMRKVMVSEEKWNNETKRLERIDLYEAWFHQFGNDECGENNSVTVAIVERISDGTVDMVFPGNIRFIDANEEYERWIDERDSVVKLLRTVCAEHGDNDWPDNLHLYDVIEKHLFLNLEESKRNKLSGALSDQEIIAIAESMPEGVKAFGVNWGFIKLARAIEAAHGIGE